jgi:hypothetical protein
MSRKREAKRGEQSQLRDVPGDRAARSRFSRRQSSPQSRSPTQVGLSRLSRVVLALSVSVEVKNGD